MLCMLEQIKNNDLIITENKQLILDYMNNNKKLLNIKIMNLKQFIDNYFGYTDTLPYRIRHSRHPDGYVRQSRQFLHFPVLLLYFS